MSEQKPGKPPQQQQGGMLGGRGGFGGMGMPVEKAKNFKETFNRLVRYLMPFKLQLIIVIFFAVLSTAFNIVGPKIMGHATTKLMEGLMGKFLALRTHQIAPSIDFVFIGNIVLLLVFFYLISSLFGFIQQYIMAGVSQKTVFNLRKSVN